jgi:hypothetical protein
MSVHVNFWLHVHKVYSKVRRLQETGKGEDTGSGGAHDGESGGLSSSTGGSSTRGDGRGSGGSRVGSAASRSADGRLLRGNGSRSARVGGSNRAQAGELG